MATGAPSRLGCARSWRRRRSSRGWGRCRASGWCWLAVVIALEVGDVTRFATAEKLAAYAGTTPRGHASGGRVRYGALRADANRYLRWAFVEAANTICLHRTRHPEWHVSRLYARLAARKGHHKAVGAVARHLAEATYWMLRTEEVYREPARARSSMGDERGCGMSA